MSVSLREVPRLTGNPALVNLSKFLDEVRDILINTIQNSTINTALYDVHIQNDSKHRMINDTGTAVTDLLSADKVYELLSGGALETILITGVNLTQHTLTFNSQGRLTSYSNI